MVDRIDVAVDDDNGFEIAYTSDGDLVTTLGFDTAIKMSILSEQRAEPEEVPVPRFRRGWIGNLDQEFPIGSKIWLSDQTTRVQSTLNDMQEAAESGLQWFLDDDLAENVEVVTSFSIDGVSIEAIISIENKPTETQLFRLWEFTGI